MKLCRAPREATSEDHGKPKARTGEGWWAGAGGKGNETENSKLKREAHTTGQTDGVGTAWHINSKGHTVAGRGGKQRSKYSHTATTLPDGRRQSGRVRVTRVEN